MGTCYRRIGKSDKTIEEFKKGLSYQPNHAQGLINMGIVLAYDFKDAKGAIESWEKFLKAAPTHPMTDNIRQEIAKFKLMEPTEITPE